MVGIFEDGLVEKDDTAMMREKALVAVKSFTVIKNAIWMTSNVWNNTEGKAVPKIKRTVNLTKLRILMEEIQFLLESNDSGMTRGLNER